MQFSENHPPTTHHHHGLMTCPSSLCLVQRPLSVTPGRCFAGFSSSELSSDEEKSSWIQLWTQHDMSSPENILCKMLGILGDLLWKMKAQWNPDVNQFLRQKIVSLYMFLSGIWQPEHQREWFRKFSAASYDSPSNSLQQVPIFANFLCHWFKFAAAKQIASQLA